MRIFIVIAIFLTLLAHTFSKGIIYMQFYMNQEYITQTLCENKDQPELKCEGNCQLQKSLKKENEREGKNLVKEPKEIVWFFTPIALLVEVAINYISTPQYFQYQEDKIEKTPRLIFHPPAIC